MASYSKVCAYCGEPYIAKQSRGMYCSRKCKDIAIRLRKGIPCNPNPKPFQKVCCVCGKQYESFREASVTCSSECAKQNDLVQKRKKYHKFLKCCAICGKGFVTGHDSQMTCGDDLCKLEYKQQAHRRRNEKALRIKPQGKIHTIVEKECKYCGTLFQCFDYDASVCCSAECKKRREYRKRDKRIPKEQIIDTDITLLRLFKRDHGVCWICGVLCNWEDKGTTDRGGIRYGKTYPSQDHVVPVSRGGLHSWDNVRLAHWQCNADKSDSLFPYVPLDKAFAYSEKRYGIQPKKTAQYSLDGNLIRVWDSTGQIQKELGLSSKHIQNVCRRGKSNTGNAYGFHWEYLDG